MLAKKLFNNGLRAIIVPTKDNPTVTVLVLVATGSKYETKRINGISHFLEHMCFKGTLCRPTALDITKELDSLGSQYNAFTSHEYTGYYAKSDARHFKKIFNIISDIYLNSIFSDSEIKKEKGVIIEERNMYKDLPNKHVQDMIMQLLYGNQPAGWNIVGEQKTILGLKREDFLSYRKKYYIPKNTLIIVSGNVNETDVTREINNSFSKIQCGSKSTKRRVIEKQIRPQAFVEFKKTDQTHFILGFRSYNLFSKDNPGLSVLSCILGGGMSSRLFQILREEMGVCYYIHSENDSFTDHGIFQIASGVDNKRVKEVIKVMLIECQRLKIERVSEEELDRVKEYLIGNMKLSLESTDQIANFYGLQELLRKKIYSIKEQEVKIRSVTSTQIQALANDIFQNNKLNLVINGPFHPGQEKEFLKLLKI